VSPRATLTLAVILALVVGYIFVVDRPQAQRAEEAKHLVQLPSQEIITFTLDNTKGTTAVTRRDATHWDVTSPLHVPAAAFAVNGLLDSVTGLVQQKTLGASASDIAAYGLDKPAERIQLATAGGKTATLEIGKAAPVGNAVYARVGGPGGNIYLVDTSIKDALNKSAADLRQKTLADFTNADVQQVRIVSPTGTLVVDRLAPDRWKIEGPHVWPADDFKVTDLFFPLTTTDAKAFHDGVTDLSAYGLDHPTITADLTLAGRKDPLRILLAQREKVVYGTVAGSPTVLEFDPSVMTKLSPDPMSLVSRRVLPYNAQDLTSLTWRRGGHTLEVRRQGPGFTGGGLSDKEISDMFSAVNLLDADKVEPLASPPAGAPAFEVQSDGAADARYLVQFYPAPKGGWIAVDQALALQYQLTGNVLDGMPQPVKAFLGLAEAPKPAAAPAPGAPKPGATTPAPPKQTK